VFGEVSGRCKYDNHDEVKRLLPLRIDKRANLLLLLLLVLVPIQTGVVRTDVSTTTSISPQIMIVILVEFSDLKHTAPQDKMHDLIFSGLNKYYSEVSYGQIGFTGKTVGWYQLPNPVAHYAVGQRKNYNASQVRPFIKSAVDAADDDVDFSKYSYVMVVHAGDSNPLWWCLYVQPKTIGTPIATNDWVGSNRVGVKESILIGETDPLGVIAHEVAHCLGGLREQRYLGLPDLFDLDLNEGKYCEVFMGSWCLMSVPDGSLCAWSKLKLGWIPARAIVTVFPWRSNATATIDPLELPTSGTHVVMIPLTGKTYYLVEVRQQIGVDKILPGSGVLITLADDSKYESTKKGPVRVIDSTPETSTLDDATFDLGQGKKSAFFDRENNLSIMIVGKLGSSYEVFIGPVGEGERISLATTAIEEAKASIQRAETEGRTEGLDRAKALLVNSSAALDKGDYAAALAFAKQAKEAADSAVRASKTQTKTSTTDIAPSLPTNILIPAIVALAVLIGIFLALEKGKKNRSQEAAIPWKTPVMLQTE